MRRNWNHQEIHKMMHLIPSTSTRILVLHRKLNMLEVELNDNLIFSSNQDALCIWAYVRGIQSARSKKNDMVTR